MAFFNSIYELKLTLSKEPVPMENLGGISLAPPDSEVCSVNLEPEIFMTKKNTEEWPTEVKALVCSVHRCLASPKLGGLLSCFAWLPPISHGVNGI